MLTSVGFLESGLFFDKFGVRYGLTSSEELAEPLSQNWKSVQFETSHIHFLHSA